MILSGGINIGKMRADQIQQQQQAELEAARNLILQQQVIAKEKKDEIAADLAERKLTRQEAVDAAREVDRDLDRKITQQNADTMAARLERIGRGDGVSRQIFKKPDGSYVFADGSPAPGVPASDTANQATPSQAFDLSSKLVTVKSAVLTGKDGDQELPETSRDAYMKAYNEASTTDQIVKTPGVVRPWYQGGNTDATYTVVPKTSAAQTSGTAPLAAIEHLRKNPQLKEQFKLKYGYIPEGM